MSPNAPTRQLTLFDSMCIIAGVVIGAGIYETTPLIASNVASPTSLLMVWVIGGVISLVGAFCYAELATAYPKDGGDFVYLSRAYGPRAGFLFAWTEYWMVRPGSIGMMAFVFARFANQLYPLTGPPFDALGKLVAPSAATPEAVSFVVYAVGSIVVLTITNSLGVKSGKWTQNALTVAKVLGLIAIFIVGLFFVPTRAAVEATPAEASDSSSFQLALILVLFTYGGWNDLSYVAAEVRNPSRNLFRALALGVTTITVIYILVNIAFLKGLGLAGTASNTVAVDLLTLAVGDYAGRAISLLICFSCLGAINGTLFAGSRIYYAVGTEHKLVSWLGSWSGRFDAPVRALLFQGGTAVVWTMLFGNEQGFQRLLIFTAPVFWFFAFMVALSVIVLREKDRDTPRQHQVVFYPWLPIFFALSCAFMLESSVTYALSNWRTETGWAPEALASVGVICAGIAVATFAIRKK
ncbi:MAG: amino acid permease [Planctomycetaceae bacterium]|nr:amino acid permease [Planctomycetaceae bacterium]